MAFEDHRADRVTTGGDEDGAAAEQLATGAGDVDPDQRRDPGEADQEAEQAAAVDPVFGFEAQGEDGDDQRRRGDQDRRSRGGDPLLAEARARKGDRDLGDREGESQRPRPRSARQQARRAAIASSTSAASATLPQARQSGGMPPSTATLMKR